MKLSPTVSYQSYKDRFILLDSVTGLEIQLNKAGGNIIRRIDEGNTEKIDPDSDFILHLLETGILDSRITEKTEMKSEKKNFTETAVFDDLNIYASRELIPVSGILELTYRCPLQCKHCYVDRNEVTKDGEITKEDYFRFIDEFREMGGLYVILTGGDPFLHKDIEEIFNYLRKKRIAVSIMSSGYKTDKELLKRFVSSGLTGFQASIHGNSPHIHDSFTGVEGSFTETMETLYFLKGLGVKVQAAVSVNKNNISHFDSMLSLFKKTNIETVFNFEMFPKRNGDNSPASLNISETELYECLKKTERVTSFRLKEKKPEDPPCNSARSLFSMDPAGNIFPCLEIRKKAGNIKNDSFSNIWINSEILNKIRTIRIKDLKDCVQCDMRNFCNRCHGGALKKKTDILDHSEFDCKFAKLHSILNKNFP